MDGESDFGYLLMAYSECMISTRGINEVFGALKNIRNNAFKAIMALMGMRMQASGMLP